MRIFPIPVNFKKPVPSAFISLLPLVVLVGMLVLVVRTYGSDALAGASQVTLLVVSALCVALGSAASAAGRLICPAVSDRTGRKPVLYAVYAGLAAGSAAFAFAQNWWVVAAYCLLTFFYSGGAAVQPALNTDLFGLAHAGVNYGLMALGMSAGSLLSYAGSQLLPLGARHILAAACAVAGGICFAFVKPPGTVENRPQTK